MHERPPQTRMILHAAARVLGCGSAQLAIVDEDRRALVFRIGVANRELPRLAAVESTLGFPLEGAMLPLSVEESLLVRALRQGRLIVAHEVSELAGGLLSREMAAAIQETIGPRSFAAVPITGRSGALGVLLFEKQGEDGFSGRDRELILDYAERVGANLESQALSDDARRLAALEAGAGAAPVLYSCDPELVVTTGAAPGRPLWEVLEVASGPLLEALPRLADGPATVALRTSSGKPLRLTLEQGPGRLVVVAAEDLEEGERLKREVSRAREHLAKVLGSVADAILTLEADGRIDSGNDAVERILGFPVEELTGLAASELCGDQASTRRAAAMRREVLDTGFSERELKLRRKDGSCFAAAVSALLLADDQGQPVGMVFRIHDLTERRRGAAERKRLRAKLLHSERLSALGEMAARIAHEVRNPLVSIGAAAQVVAEELGPDSPVAAEVRAIAREVRRLDAIVGDFLGFARPRRADRRPVELAAVLAESVALVRGKTQSPELRLHVDGPLRARCDPDAVKQVLLNVLLNAVEGAPEGMVECDARMHRDRVVISVGDRGPGIPPGLRRRIFDPFVSTKARGTGLGLAVCKQIVDEHQGRIRLLNRRGGGTRVVIELPVG